jgi:protoporphyrinogen oxidase
MEFDQPSSPSISHEHPSWSLERRSAITRRSQCSDRRKNLIQEELGYLEGGTETLIHALIGEIEHRGNKILLGNPVTRVVTQDGRVRGVETLNGFISADAVISTVPTPFISRLVPELAPAARAKYDSIPNIGICCLIFKLRRSLTPHFWVNFSDPNIEIPGLIEFSNLRPIDHHIVYIPYYLPTSNEKFSWPDEKLLNEAFQAMRAVQPQFQRSDVLESRVARLRYAQPICAPGFASTLPAVQTAIAGLQIADTSFYYPEDRGISESVKLGRKMARDVGYAPMLR